jgi:hypothetical protein
MYVHHPLIGTLLLTEGGAAAASIHSLLQILMMAVVMHKLSVQLTSNSRTAGEGK